MRHCLIPLFIGAALTVAPTLHAQETPDPAKGQPDPAAAARLDGVDSSSLEALTNAKILVSSVSRKEQDIDHAPAAVYVITRKDIERSAASSIPELLRGVPGVQVAQLTASTWAVSARGFNNAYANKLLVLVDGRTMYSELYSGEHWDQIDIPLLNVDRIEIIRGPGAAVWGANAVNGVINIITRPARELEGTAAAAEFSRLQGRTLVQQGGALGDRTQYRAFFSYVDRRPLSNADGTAAFDGENMFRVGGRIDFQKNTTDSFTLSADAYGASLRQQVSAQLDLPIPANGQEEDSIHGGFVQGIWAHNTQAATTTLQTYFVNEARNEISISEVSRTANAELISHARVHPRLDLVWGSEARYTYDHISGPVLLLKKPVYHNYLVSGFVQADYTLKPNVLTATIGSKVQEGTLTGAQLQPSARVLWAMNSHRSFWSATSHAVVAPSLQDKAVFLPYKVGISNGIPITATIEGNWDFKPETVTAIELGYRERFGRGISADIALFMNWGRRLQAVSQAPPLLMATPSPHILVSNKYVNGYSSKSEGAEVSLLWRPFNQMQVKGSYSWFQGKVSQTIPGIISLIDLVATPRNTGSVSFSWDLPHLWSITSSLYRVGNIADFKTPVSLQPQDSLGSSNAVPSYNRLDFNLQRKLRSNLVVQCGGTNLLQARHIEFTNQTSFVALHYVPRSLFARAVWSF